MIIAFVQTKGGTGKSTLALNIAFSETIRSEFPSIALVELDPQGTLGKWWSRRDPDNNQFKSVSFYHISSPEKDDILEEIDLALGILIPSDCQAGRADVPVGTPPYCSTPDDVINVLDVLVIIDMALGKSNCCDYYFLGKMY